MAYIPALPVGFDFVSLKALEVIFGLVVDPWGMLVYPSFKSGWTLPAYPLLQAFLRHFQLLVCQVHPNSYKIIHTAANLYAGHSTTLQLDTFLKMYHPHLNNTTTEAYSLLFTRRKFKSLIFVISVSEKYWNTKPIFLRGNVFGVTEGDMPRKNMWNPRVVVNLPTLESMTCPERAMFERMMALPQEERH